MLFWVLLTFLKQAFCVLIEEYNTSTLKDTVYFFKKNTQLWIMYSLKDIKIFKERYRYLN